MARPGPGMPHGIYKLSDGTWILYRREGGPLKPGEAGDGTYIIYFYNIRCPACRMFSPQWSIFAETMAPKLGENIHLFVVLCDWFSRDCDSPAAAETFNTLDIDSSPTVVIMKVEGGKVIDSITLPGYRRAEELFKIAKRYT
ncbi:MAG: thioredoxin family protein [Desulfurococcales archaeon]|nr:thioredoxin family protein [Desulfurococcales archaeon]